jgi:hypothetical protein
MKYLLIALLLIGSAKGQDSLGFQIGHTQFIFELIGQDSIGMCGYQKPDSPFVVIGDSARIIKVLAESLDRTGKFHVRWPVSKSFAAAIPINLVTVHELYPWWKKALWLIAGQLSVLFTFIIIKSFPNNFKL